MKITYDPSVDALYISFKEGNVSTEHWSESVAADFDSEGHLAGIEVLDASEVFDDFESLKQLSFEEFPVSAKGRRD